MIRALTTICNEAMRTIAPATTTIPSTWTSVITTYSGNDNTSHFQSNAALTTAKALKCAPIDTAHKICSVLETYPQIAEAYASPPGFINIRLTPECIQSQAFDIAAQKGILIPEQPERILVDFGSPNFGKELHVGHMRSAVIGDTLSRIFEHKGHSVERVSHVGDFGAAFATTVCASEARQCTSISSSSQLAELYELGKRTIPDETIQAYILDMQRGKTLPSSHNVVRDASRLHIQEMNERLGVQVEERGESFYQSWIPQVIERLQQVGEVVEAPNGGLIAYPQGKDKPHMVIRKADGGYLYASTDLAALRERYEHRHLQRVIYCTDEGQQLHFRQLFTLGARAGIYDPERMVTQHAYFGTVQGPDGKKLKSRDGRAMPLAQLLDMVVEKVQEASPSREAQFHERLAMSAVRYYELSHIREKNYTFDLTSMLAMKGNTALYAQYAVARIVGVLNGTQDYDQDIDPQIDQHRQEEALWVALLIFPDVLEQVEKELRPHILCEYIYSVSQKFHKLYDTVPIRGNPRLERLCVATKQVLEASFELVGISAEERM